MSSKWMKMRWKGNDSVFVDKNSWKSQSGLVEYKYNMSNSRLYKGSRVNFSPLKSIKTTKTKTKPFKFTNHKHSSLPISPTTTNNQKIHDFRMIATSCSHQIASNLLRNSDFNVQKALEFYFKHQTKIDSAQMQSHNTKPKPKPRAKRHSQIKLGKAGTRTKKQTALVKEQFNELFASFGDNEIVCFTDGACKGNPGPAGSGAIVLFGKRNSNDFIQKSMALGRGTNNIAELYAIGLTLCILTKHPSAQPWINALTHKGGNNGVIIRILSDSKYSIGVLDKGWKAKKNKELIGWIRQELHSLRKSGAEVTMHWVGGHSGIKYNEIADRLANKGVEACVKGKNVNVTEVPNLFRKVNLPLRRGRAKKRKFVDLCDDNRVNTVNRKKRRKLNGFQSVKKSDESDCDGNTNSKCQ